MAWPIVGTMDNGDDVDDFRPISNYFKQTFVTSFSDLFPTTAPLSSLQN